MMGAGASAARRTAAILPARRAEAAICHRAQSINCDNVREIRLYVRFSGHFMLAADRGRMVDLRAGQGLGALPRPRWLVPETALSGRLGVRHRPLAGPPVR